MICKPVRLLDAELEIPVNWQAPIAARLGMSTVLGIPIDAELDWRQTGPQTWDIVIETDEHALCLSHGGNTLVIDGEVQDTGPEAEYPGLYRRFVELIGSRQSDVDLAPLQLVTDVFLRGRSQTTDAFE